MNKSPRTPTNLVIYTHFNIVGEIYGLGNTNSILFVSKMGSEELFDGIFKFVLSIKIDN
jgi:hypothetical protein